MAWELQVEGTIPKDLVGTYYRNGPGMQVYIYDADKEHVKEPTLRAT